VIFLLQERAHGAEKESESAERRLAFALSIFNMVYPISLLVKIRMYIVKRGTVKPRMKRIAAPEEPSE
jgi:hypothetical protein